MLEIDGSHGEGGGAILRQALALSIHTGKAFKINNIRANRDDPGMKMQHLKALNAAHLLCNAEVKGNKLGSTEVTFNPGKLASKNLKIDVETAGSITLLLQSVLLPCVLSDKKFKIEVRGGTDVKWAQPIDYFQNVFIPQTRRWADVTVETEKRGYYPKGNGKVTVTIQGEGSEKQINLTRKEQLLQIKGTSHSSMDLEERQVSERQARNAEAMLSDYKVPINISRDYANTESIGSGITLWAIYGDDEGIDFDNPVIIGADSLGEPRKKAEEIGEEAAVILRREIESGAIVDKYLADQLIPYLGIVGGEIKTSEITAHTLSNIYVAEKFLGKKYEVQGETVRVG